MPEATTTPDEHLERLASLWRQERAAARARFESARQSTTLARRVARGIALDDLLVVEEQAAPRDRVRVALAVPDRVDLDALRMGPGDPVLLGDGAARGRTFRGVLTRRDGQRLWVMVDGELPEELVLGRVVVEAAAPLVTFDRGDTAIARARAARGDSARLLAMLMSAREVGRVAATAWQPLDDALDDVQRRCVDLALRDDVALVHGPPGTGKTRTLVEIIRQLAGRGLRVLATAASNTAVDNLGERLARAGLAPVRIGHPARVADALEHATLDARVDVDGAAALAREWRDRARELRRRGRRDREAMAEARNLERDARRELANAEAAILGRTRVVLATCTGADHPALEGLPFDVAVIDEATQAVDPLALIPALRAPRLVLAGDPHQLPPTVIDVGAARAGLGSTFFERLAARAADGGPGAATMLVRQHRMHEAIMRFPSETTYGGRLIAAPEVAGHVLEDLGVAPDPLRPTPVLLVDTAGKDWTDRRGGLEPGDEDDADPSTWNPGHAERVAAEVRRLLSRGVRPADIAVIAAYDAQVRRLRALLAAERVAGLEVATVDAFQGREKEAVIVDLVRSNERGDIGFLADVRRMNVALTRARRFLLVVGDSATLGEHPYYAAFVAAMDELGTHGSAWSDDAEPL
jgi:ATP-dependent RNA/DNA helicase IGHMBP2